MSMKVNQIQIALWSAIQKGFDKVCNVEKVKSKMNEEEHIFVGNVIGCVTKR